MTDTLARAHTLYKQGAYKDSDNLYREHLDQHPEDAIAWHKRGYVAVQMKDIERAVEYISRAIELKPNVYTMHVNLGSALAMLGQFEQATKALQKAIELHPTGAEAHLALGNCLKAKGNPQDAEAAYLQALRFKPDWPEALEAAAVNAAKSSNPDKSLEYALQALAHAPERLLSNKIAGNVYLRQRKYELSLKHYEAALRSDPNDAAANANLGLLLTRTAQYEESAAAYAKAVELAPNDAVAEHGLSLALLVLGRLSEGWPHFEARLQREGHLLGSRPYSAPRIKQRPINKHALAWADEGVGEQIMFASMIPEIVADSTSMSVECDARLAPLFQRSFSNLDIIPRHDPPHPKFNAPYDGQFCLGSAARWYRPNFESFPRQPGYLVADAHLTQVLRKSYQSITRPTPLIGISWRTKAQTKFSPEKTLGLANWGPLLSVPGATFVNLQYGDCRTEISETERSLGVHILSDSRIDSLKDLDSFASQVAAMDLVITISNATAHMAGALNVPVWTMVPKGFGAMWHWFLDRDDSPWYPSMRLLRQTKQNEWGSVVDRASSMLADFVTQWRPAPSNDR